MKVFGNKFKKALESSIHYLFEVFTGSRDEENTYWIFAKNKPIKIRRLKPGQSIGVMRAWDRLCTPFTERDYMILTGADTYNPEVNFKKNLRYKGVFDSEPMEDTYCKLYEPKEEKLCKNPQRKCKNCSVYNGFKGSGRL